MSSPDARDARSPSPRPRSPSPAAPSRSWSRSRHESPSRSPAPMRERREEEGNEQRSPRQIAHHPRSPRGSDRRAEPRRRDAGGGGGDKYRPAKARKQRSPPPAATEEQKQAAAKAEYERLLTARSGGTYVPPARLRALQAQITDKTSMAYQRMAWDALKKSINGLINKVNVSNIKPLVPELFNENLVRGRGLFCQSAIKAQAASLPFTPIYAALVAVVNTKLPQVGELLLRRLVLRFRKAFRRNDKAVCLSATTFVAHLVNQQVAHEMVAGQMLLLLLNKPTDDSVEIAVGLTREVGQFLEEMNAAIANVVFDRFRDILHEADIAKRTQYMIEVLFQTRKDRFKDNPAIRDELDLVEEDDQIKHFVELDGELDAQDGLNIFKFDPEYEENEEKYKKLKAEILGEGSDYEDDSDDEGSDSSDDEPAAAEQKAMDIQDRSNADLVALRRTIYLTLMSSMDPEEAVHKLMKINLPQGLEGELPSLVVESCAQERTYSKFYGAIGERLAKINRLWTDLFEKSFEHYYTSIHRYETNRLRNIARFFGHMFSSDAIGWHCLSVIHLNEEETTSASRIFIKILFQEISEAMGMPKLHTRTKDAALQPYMEGLFPRDTARNIRFSINYFTSIGMGVLTEDSREFLQNMPKPALPAPPPDSDSESSSSYSSYTGSSYSRSRSPSPRRRSYSRSRSRSVTPRRTNSNGRNKARSPSRSVSRSISRSRSPAPIRGRSYSRSVSRSRSRSYSRSVSRSPTPPRRQAPAQQRGRQRSYTPSDRSRSRSYSRSRSPRGRSYTRSPDRAGPQASTAPRSGGPPRKAGSVDNRSPLSRSPSGSRSPSPRRRRDSPSRSPVRDRESGGRAAAAAPGNSEARRGRSYSRSPSRTRSPSPAPSRRRRRDSSSDASAPRKRRRESSR
ncbi:pre-mRNA-splicing factor cwc22 [Pyricularia oryzae]|uniref:Pre-mRNA-splicing factor CWC22 n=2 Tax=Pyricularia oryzae TaxID=318829 RepID=A0AA97PRQ0_PYRO3|nr:pre-mRNA-splicing factor cwc22 [Pyricularia oryzae Y34]KAI7932449.1 pre-mRNA-splicing factor cwc22 [Pyricularia oryzae]